MRPERSDGASDGGSPTIGSGTGSEEGLFRKGEERHGLLPAHGREVGQELVERDAGGEGVDEGVDGHAGADEDRLPG